MFKQQPRTIYGIEKISVSLFAFFQSKKEEYCIVLYCMALYLFSRRIEMIGDGFSVGYCEASKKTDVSFLLEIFHKLFLSQTQKERKQNDI